MINKKSEYTMQYYKTDILISRNLHFKYQFDFGGGLPKILQIENDLNYIISGGERQLLFLKKYYSDGHKHTSTGISILDEIEIIEYRILVYNNLRDWFLNKKDKIIRTEEYRFEKMVDKFIKNDPFYVQKVINNNHYRKEYIEYVKHRAKN